MINLLEIKNIDQNLKFVLASKSPRRRQILSELGINAEIVSVDIEEDNKENLSPENYAMSLAKNKANAVLNNTPGTIIIGMDTIVLLNNKILEKPKDREDAFNMLSQLSGKKHKVVTGVHIKLENLSKTFFERTNVYFKKLSKTEIEWYLDTNEPYDKAGSYGIQGYGRLLIKKIEGCFFNVVGFPAHQFYIVLNELLKEFQYENI